MKIINKLSIGLIPMLFVFSTCSPYGDYGDYGEDITSPIVITNSEHHVGDNEGAEGIALTADFTMPSSFSKAELSITFPNPNSHGTSGFDAVQPPEITINGSKVGIWPSQLTEYPNCIDSYQDFVCTITFTYDITSVAKGGVNTFVVRSVSYLDSADDFVFKDVLVSFN